MDMNLYDKQRLFFELTLIATLITVIFGNVSPNFIVILADDVGYGDFQCYGNPVQEHGAIDELAHEGMRFTQWYSAATTCTPSRAALLTGRLPVRSGIVGSERVFWQHDTGGLPKSEVTIAEELTNAGYVTGIIGKWHLGINEFEANDGNHLPHHHGFNYVGNLLPFTYHWRCDPQKDVTISEMSQKCFLYRGKEIIEQPINSSTLTQRIRTDAIEFIKTYKNMSFFLYLAMPQTHSSLFCSSRFCNKSKRGLYGDSINEMAWTVDGIKRTLKSLSIENNTLVLFLSDHGPQIELCHEGGSSGFLKGGKATTWDGGIRVPAIAWWPGTIPSGAVNRQVVSTLDIFPTMLDLAGVKPTTALDGASLAKSLLNLSDEDSPPIHDMLTHYCSDKLMAVRIGIYKIHYFTLPLNSTMSSCINGIPWLDAYVTFSCEASVFHDPPLIFDMDRDPGERYPLDPHQHSSLLERATEMVKQHKHSIIPVPSQFGKMNPAVTPCCNPPLCRCNYHATDRIKKDEL